MNTKTSADREQLHRATIACLAGDEQLRQRIVLRGAAALRLFYGGPRPIRDFDMVVLRAASEAAEKFFVEPDRTVQLIKSRLSTHLLRYHPHLATDYQNVLHDLHFDISVCGERIECTRREVIVGSGETILVSTDVDILASKLTVIFDQSISVRPTDLFDVVHLISKTNIRFDPKTIADLAKKKSADRDVVFDVAVIDERIQNFMSCHHDEYRLWCQEAEIDCTGAWNLIRAFISRVPSRPA